MSFYAQYPASSSGTSTNASIGTNGATAPTSATEVAGVNPSGNLQPLQTDSAGNLLVDIASPIVSSGNITEFASNPVQTGTGASGAGIPRVTVSNDSSVLVSSLPSLPAGSNAIGSVSVSNFPATQPVSGSVSVSNFPATQPVSGTVAVSAIQSALPAGTNAIGSVSVSNFPATQPVSGTVAVSSIQSALPAGTNALGSVSVSNFPATQPVSGTVAVSSIQSALPSGTNTIGAISNTSFAATQATASALNATVVGSGTAGSPASGVVTIQGITGGTAIPVSGTITASNPSVGTDGSAAPTSSTQIGGSDGTNLQPLQVDASKNLKVNLQTSLPAGTNAIGSITNTSFAVTQATASNLNATVVQSTPANLQATVTPASGSTFTVVQPTASALNVDVGNFPSSQAVTGTVTVTQSTPASLQSTVTPASGASFTVSQATASNLNATIAPLTSASTVTVVQPTGTNLHAVLDSGSTTAVTQATAANLNATVVGTGTFATQVTSLPSIPAGTNTIGKVLSAGSPGPANAPVYNVYSTTNISTTAYTQLIASTTSATTYVDIFDSSGQAMILAVGASGSEVIQAYIGPGGDSFSLQIPAGSRVAYKALTANATTGYLLLNLFQ